MLYIIIILYVGASTGPWKVVRIQIAVLYIHARARPLFLRDLLSGTARWTETCPRQNRRLLQARMNSDTMLLRGNPESNHFKDGGCSVNDNPWDSYILKISTDSVEYRARGIFIIPAYTTSLVTTSTSYRTRGFLIWEKTSFSSVRLLPS